jgi:hypothetical protein
MNSSKQHILTIHQKAFVWHPLGDIEAIFSFAFSSFLFLFFWSLSRWAHRGETFFSLSFFHVLFVVSSPLEA